MKSYQVDVRINGSTSHVVCGKRATVPEIALLRAIHGNDAVLNLRSVQDVPAYSEDEERERLRSIYDDRQRDEGPLMERLFGMTARLPLTLADIGIDAKAAAKQAKADAAAAAARAAELQADAEADDAALAPVEDAEAAAFS